MQISDDLMFELTRFWVKRKKEFTLWNVRFAIVGCA